MKKEFFFITALCYSFSTFCTPPVSTKELPTRENNQKIRFQCSDIIYHSLEANPGKILFHPEKFADYMDANPRIFRRSMHEANLAITTLIMKQAGLTYQEKIIDIVLMQGEIIRVLNRRNFTKNVPQYMESIDKLLDMGAQKGLSPETRRNVHHFLCHRWEQCHCNAFSAIQSNHN